MRKSSRTAKGRGPAGRREVRQQTRRVNVPRSSQRSVERSGQSRHGKRG